MAFFAGVIVGIRISMTTMRTAHHLRAADRIVAGVTLHRRSAPGRVAVGIRPTERVRITVAIKIIAAAITRGHTIVISFCIATCLIATLLAVNRTIEDVAALIETNLRQGVYMY